MIVKEMENFIYLVSPLFWKNMKENRLNWPVKNPNLVSQKTISTIYRT